MPRPRRSELDKLRTKVWYESIRWRLSLRTAYEMDSYFGSGTDRNWYKYESGERVPTHATLDFVERKCKGSRVVFDNGPCGYSFWKALSAPHSELWGILDVTFPEHVAFRKAGVLGLLQYANFLDKRLILEKYASHLDYLSHAKGIQKNCIALAVERDEITIDYQLAATIIVLWRFSALVIYNLHNADYLLAGLISAFNKSKINNDNFEPLIGKLLQEWLVIRAIGE